jgi:MFS family permease
LPFRNLLIANVVSDIAAFVQTVGAAWLMMSLKAGAIYVALIQTASALPFFLFALPAGALGDIVDRRRLILFTEIWMAFVAVALVMAVTMGFISPWLLLAVTFALWAAMQATPIYVQAAAVNCNAELAARSKRSNV